MMSKFLSLFFIFFVPGFSQDTAPAGAGPQSFGISNLVLLGAIILVFYFVLIRPANKQKKVLEQKRSNLKKGDKIVTSGGLIVKFEKFKSDTVALVKIDGNTEAELLRQMIVEVLDADFEKRLEKNVTENSSKKKSSNKGKEDSSEVQEEKVSEVDSEKK